MRQIAIGVFITCALILLFAFAFTLYGQFALDYSLEALKEALHASQTEDPSDWGSRAHSASLDAIVLEEIAEKEVDLESVILLEQAARAIRDAVEKSGYTRAGFYIVEVLNEKSAQRTPLLKILDALYQFWKTLVKSLQDLWAYILRRFQPLPEEKPLEGAGVILLGEAEAMEKAWKLEEAARYYREFLDRYPARPERGFVTLALAHVLMKMRQFGEAETLFQKVRKEFPGAREDALALTFLNHLSKIRQQEALLPGLEAAIKAEPSKIFEKEGGLKLALTYMATYQPNEALSVLERMSEAPDAEVREKALFYRGWIYSWQGDLDQAKEIFLLLEQKPRIDDTVALATEVKLAAVYDEKKEYKEALDHYKKLSRMAAVTAWKALSELEQSEIYFFGLGDDEAAKQSLQRLDQIMARSSTPLLELARMNLGEAVQRGKRDEAFGALAQGKVEVAFDLFKEYLEQFPRDGSAHSGIGSIYLLKGDLEKALEEAKIGYGLQIDEYTAAVLGYVYIDLEDLETAEDYYIVSTQIKPSYVTAQFNLSWIYIITERYKEADERLAGLEAMDPEPAPMTHAKILNNRGVTLWHLGEKGEATARFQKALERIPDLPEAQKNLSLVKGERPLAAAAESPV